MTTSIFDGFFRGFSFAGVPAFSGDEGSDA